MLAAIVIAVLVSVIVSVFAGYATTQVISKCSDTDKISTITILCEVVYFLVAMFISWLLVLLTGIILLIVSMTMKEREYE